jgi:hypothetical protein
MSNPSLAATVVRVEPQDQRHGSVVNEEQPTSPSQSASSYEAEPEPSERLLFNLSLLVLLVIAVLAVVWWLSR